MKIGLFYGSTTCYTEMAAEKIQAAMGTDLVEIFNIKDVPLSDCLQYDIIIFGISTWDFGELQEDWESSWDDITSLNLQDKIVALFGLGDQVGYGQWFQDALGMLHDQIIPQGANIIGYWPNQGYEFEESKALTPDKDFFVGLSLDDETQYDLSEQRIENWSEQILEEMSELLA
ncbi:flavodoxin FldB [Thalassotalea fonticola]|uniref:Flavodoxin n=1 Tax=Thalassotalea fonticola TaxID=3065649 RepID=A0ABZ0GP14_9GAMM|nr:flavodoxin FldB [Colwelliaceae bacterium S1-1]